MSEHEQTIEDRMRSDAFRLETSAPFSDGPWNGPPAPRRKAPASVDLGTELQVAEDQVNYKDLTFLMAAQNSVTNRNGPSSTYGVLGKTKLFVLPAVPR